MVEEVRKLNSVNEDLRNKIDKCNETGYQELAEDEEWLTIQKAKRDMRNAASVGREKLNRIADEVSVPKVFTLKSAVSALRTIKKIVDDK